jgi:hypothetical protein
MTAVGIEEAVLEPLVLVAVTATRRVDAWSAVVSV